MKFDTLNKMIPAVVGEKKHIVKMQPYNAITLRMPGRHQNETTPPGLDFVVCVDDEEMDWTEHQFTHTDLFRDLEAKRSWAYAHDLNHAEVLMQDYLSVVFEGHDPERMRWDDSKMPGVHPQTFLYAVQCLAVAEHRRYARYESKFGGRYLPFRFGAGIVEGLWTATDAAEKQKRGRPGVEWLEKDFGVPVLTKELMG